ncbi:hypothetical protein RCN67_16855, partial [Escherichia marmotae]|nr:hypothetical protein [Escherichia marmotae]
YAASGSCAPMPDATLTRLIRPTSPRPNGRPDKAVTPHPAIVHRCLMRRCASYQAYSLHLNGRTVGRIRRLRRIRQLCTDA